MVVFIKKVTVCVCGNVCRKLSVLKLEMGVGAKLEPLSHHALWLQSNI